MPARSARFHWNKQGDFNSHASAHRVLPTGVTITAVDAELHQRVSVDPEDWDDRTSEVTVTASVEDALKRKGQATVVETDGEDRGIRVTITKDPDPQPDASDEPEPDDNYRVRIILTRSDTGRPEAHDVPLTILP